MNKIVLITGGTSGIGLQIATDLLSNNYKVIINGRNKDNIKKVISSFPFNLKRFNCETWQADLSHIIELTSPFIKKIKNIDVLILNIGTTDRTPFGQITVSQWNKVFNTNLTIPFFLVQALKDKINNNGRIIFISSVLAKEPHSRSISYAVSKAGVNTLVKNLVKEFASRHITVNAIAPGFVDSPWHKDKKKAQLNRVKSKIALKRFGTVKEVSSLVQEVIRNEYINGAILPINGGYNFQ